MPPARPRAPKAPSRPPRQASNRRPPSRRPPVPSTERSFLWRWRRGLFLVGLLLVAFVSGTGFVLAQIELPPARFQAQTTFICAADVTPDQGCTEDNAMARLYDEQDRVDVTLEEVPEVLVQAVLAAEDRDFFDHRGVDPIGIARAAWQDIRGGGVSQGGSTITQQYVKTVYLSNERTITRKIKEAVLAIKLEQQLSKEEILERYLNAIYFGRGAYGIGTAARAYFGHGLNEVDVAEAAYLAGLIRAPEAGDATRDPEEASRRRRTVLAAMLEEGYIDQATYDAADAEPWIVGETIQARRDRHGLDVRRGAEMGTEYFVEYVRLQLLERGFAESEIYGGGLRVYTSLDYRAQQAAWNAVRSTLTEPDDPEAALVAVDNGGFVRAMVAGRDFATNEFNYATGSGGVGRQPGSSMKPFVLATAITQNISLSSKFDAPGRVTLEIPGEDWDVGNYGDSEQGILTLLDATRVSSNTAYAQLMLEVGPENVVALANRMGLDGLDAVPALVLGTEEVTPLEMAGAYSTFANGGLHRNPLVITEVVRPDGSRVTFDQEADQVLTPEQDALVVHALRQVVSSGTATAARLGVPSAGKTGTTQRNLDAWFIGFTPNALTAAVWNGDGIKDPRFMSDVHGRSVTGGSFPAEIWRKFMSEWVAIVGGDVGRFPSVSSFPGTVLNPDLTTTTSTLPECPAGASTTTAPCVTTTTESTTTTVPETTPTTPAPTTVVTVPDTTPTTPPPTTTTTIAPVAPPP
jgi:penicillin-binding protein 1A